MDLWCSSVKNVFTALLVSSGFDPQNCREKSVLCPNIRSILENVANVPSKNEQYGPVYIIFAGFK